MHEEISNRDNEIDRMKENTIQLDNVSFKKLWSALISLPIGKLIGVGSTLIAVLIGVFTLGSLYERTGANNELFDLRNSSKELQDQNVQLKDSYDSLKIEMKNIKDTAK
ncbi:MAG TPA: hypothetical protein VE978_27885 [Chitinophagales bacterium]|nr:hypothetical protein [Chitinophagales bacterium]